MLSAFQAVPSREHDFDLQYTTSSKVEVSVSANSPSYPHVPTSTSVRLNWITCWMRYAILYCNLSVSTDNQNPTFTMGIVSRASYDHMVTYLLIVNGSHATTNLPVRR